MSIQNLFPTPLGIYKINRSFTSDEINFIFSLKTKPNVGNKTSTNNNVLRTSELSNVLNFVEFSIKNHIDKVLCPFEDFHLAITQSWVNFANLNDFHHKHNHPNSYLSGVFYIQADRAVDKINFFRDHIPIFEIESKEFNSWNSPGWSLQVGSGDLLLFPSYLNHSVDKIDAKRDRVSLSFNTFPFGRIGNYGGGSLVNINNVC